MLIVISDFSTQPQAEEYQSIEVAKPKAKRTRKKKVTTDEEAKIKQSAFLERNRIAAKKCRAKRKIQQDNISERVLVMGHINSSLKQSFAEWQAIRDDLLAEVKAIKDIPGLQDEIMAIQTHQATREPAFFWHHEQGLLPIAEMPEGYQLPVLEDPFFEQLDAPSPSPSIASSTISRKRKGSRAPETQPKRINNNFEQDADMNSSGSSPMTKNDSPMTHTSSMTSISDNNQVGEDSGMGNLMFNSPHGGFVPYVHGSAMAEFGLVDPALLTGAEIMDNDFSYFDSHIPDLDLMEDPGNFLLGDEQPSIEMWS